MLAFKAIEQQQDRMCGAVVVLRLAVRTVADSETVVIYREAVYYGK
jgi:hypothetical protein